MLQRNQTPTDERNHVPVSLTTFLLVRDGRTRKFVNVVAVNVSLDTAFIDADCIGKHVSREACLVDAAGGAFRNEE